MKITDERLKEFQEAYKLDFEGEEISLDQAREMLTRVVTLYEALLRPLPNDEREESSETPEAQPLT